MFQGGKTHCIENVIFILVLIQFNFSYYNKVFIKVHYVLKFHNSLMIFPLRLWRITCSVIRSHLKKLRFCHISTDHIQVEKIITISSHIIIFWNNSPNCKVQNPYQNQIHKTNETNIYCCCGENRKRKY